MKRGFPAHVLRLDEQSVGSKTGCLVSLLTETQGQDVTVSVQEVQ